uniref:Deleted in malignant brain tumors 1 protein-like n=1 Tax=Astyanax mexicanus TaxID=7994 RepID=A0A8B9H4B3_ASTMX
MLKLYLTLILVVGALTASSLTDSLNVRLVGGTGSCSGRVEVYYRGQWGTVCDDDWDMRDAAVVCRQMGCGGALRAHSSAHFGKGTGLTLMDNVGCSGNESSIRECRHNGFGKHDCNHGEDAGVTCSDDIRLMNGGGFCDGRVEIYHNGEWGTVCGDNWDMKDAEVVCRKMGCGRALSITHSAHFGEGNGPVLLDDVGCAGHESSLTSCSHRGLGITNCGHSEDAGVICSDVLQSPILTLISPNSTVWSQETLQFRCTAPHSASIFLDFSLCKDGKLVKSQKAQSSTTFTVTVDTSHQGQYSCNYSNFIIPSSRSNSINITVADLNVRLINGTGSCSGRVEVYYRGRWGTVCDDDFGINDAAVVCRQMGCGGALSVHSSADFGKGTGSILLDNVRCSGSESSITECRHNGFGRHDCNHGEDAGVTCSDNIRLINGSGDCDGRVEIYHDGQWGTVCGDNWDMKDAEVVCRQVGCGRALNSTHSARFGEGNGPVLLDDVGCPGRESNLRSCSHGGFGKNNCSHSEDAGVICSDDVLQSPILILISSDSTVLPGETVQFRCAIRNPSIDADFHLFKDGVSIKTQTAKSYSTFTLTVDTSDQGQYSCDYSYRKNNSIISSSRSKSISITVGKWTGGFIVRISYQSRISYQMKAEGWSCKHSQCLCRRDLAFFPLLSDRRCVERVCGRLT